MRHLITAVSTSSGGVQGYQYLFRVIVYQQSEIPPSSLRVGKGFTSRFFTQTAPRSVLALR